MENLRKFRQLAPRLILMPIVVLLVLLEMAHAVGLPQMIDITEDHTTQGIVSATFLLGFLLIEKFGETENRITQLNRQFETTANISRFSDRHQFHSHWKHMRETYDSFTIIGLPVATFFEELKKLVSKKKRCHLYLSIDNESQFMARDYLELIATCPPNHFSLSELPFPPHGTWVVAHDQTGNGVDAIFCYPALNDSSTDGLFLTAHSGKSLAACILSTLDRVTVGGGIVAPVRIYTKEQIDTVVDKKAIFAQGILDVDLGELLHGVDVICSAMEKRLSSTRSHVDVTHVCTEETIALLAEGPFVTWLRKNYEAVKLRDVTIRRIFIMPRALRKNETLIKLVEKMREEGLVVLICDREWLDARYIEDFSIYDEKHVVYISREGGAWISAGGAIARNSDSLGRVKHFRYIFDAIVNVVHQRSQ